ncbi:MAG: hypothetical protein PVF05_02610 [Gemmatimonadales bacterium]
MTGWRVTGGAAWCVAGLALAAACADDAASPPGAVAITERDSADVHLVDVRYLDRSRLPTWRLADGAALQVGTVDGPAGTRLYRVRDAVRLSDGRLVVADGGSSQLRFFAADGTFLSAAGREGDGPGEFRSLGRLARMPGDSILAYDARLHRVSVFSPTGRLARSYTIDMNGGFLLPVGAFPDGALLMRHDARDDVEGPGGVRPDALMLRVAGDGRRDTIASLPGSEATLHEDAGLAAGRPTLFGRTAVATVAPAGATGYAVLATTDVYGFTVYGPGGPTTIVRVESDPRPIPVGRFDEVVDSILATSSNDRFRKFWRGLFDRMPRHATYPAFLDLAADAAGRVWVEEISDDAERPRRWTVFEQGRPIAVVETPRALEILEFGRDEVVGLERDELETERVVSYPLRTGPAALPP